MAKNFVCLLEATAARFPHKTALIWDGGSLSYAEFHARTAGFACWLAKKGIQSGDRIALLMSNRWTFIAALLGGWKLGATIAPLSALLKQEERAAIMADLNPKLVLEDVEAEPGSWDTVVEVSSPTLVSYTSGSLGQPKGALISHSALAFASRSWAHMLALTPEDVVLAVLPLSHSYGMGGALLAPLFTGSAIALVERFSPEAVFDTIRERRVTVFPGVATMFRRLLSAPEIARADFSSLRVAASGAAPCPFEIVEEWRQRTGTRILRGYGMTELYRPISYVAEDPKEWADAIGRAAPGVEIKVVDDAGQPLPTGEMGELWIKSPAALDGYLNDPELTQETLVDGWFKTGDLATISANGLVRIVGRKRERILRGGYSVFPQEIEAVLLSHPAVAEAAVVGLPHPVLEEEVAAFVSLKQGTTASAEELSAYCQGRLAAYKYPRQIHILTALPRGVTGKVQKAELLKWKLGALST
ncbi:MAG: AMP-binding protein [Deltaproteobacteria bacterium]|nr:AMP-binding protein [Deltaproteobacteria bacterium]